MTKQLALGIVAVVAVGASLTAQQPEAYDDSPVIFNRAAPQAEAIQQVNYLQDDGDDWDQASSEGWTSTWGGRIMGDYVTWADGSEIAGSQNYFEFRRLRFYAAGKGHGVFNYKLQVDFEPEGTPGNGDSGVSIKDVYIGMENVPFFNTVLLGHFKTPFSLEELGSSRYLTFLERALPNVFAPSRELGMASYSTSDSGTLAYGIFFDDLPETEKELVDDNQGTLLVARKTWNPVNEDDGASVVHWGVGILYRDNRDGTTRFRSRPEIHEGPRVIDTGAFASDNYTTVGLEFARVKGPWSWQAEYMHTSADDAAAGNRELDAAYAYGSYFLTGESRPYNTGRGVFDRLRPNRNFGWVDGKRAGPGAVELGIRWSYLGFNDSPAGGQLNDLTVGVNWYWNPYMRVMLNWIHPYGDGSSIIGDAEGDIISMRFQVDF